MSRDPRRAEEMQRAHRPQAPARGRPREFGRDHGLDSNIETMVL